MASTEVGHAEKRVYLSQEGVLVVPSSAAIKVEAGGLLRNKVSTGGINGILTTGIDAQISNRGVTVIRSSGHQVFTLQKPTPEVLGIEKTIILGKGTTALNYIRVSTAAGNVAIKCGSSSASVIRLTSDLGKANIALDNVEGMIHIKLMALSTSRWLVTGLQPDATTVKLWIFSSCT